MIHRQKALWNPQTIWGISGYINKKPPAKLVDHFFNNINFITNIVTISFISNISNINNIKSKSEVSKVNSNINYLTFKIAHLNYSHYYKNFIFKNV